MKNILKKAVALLLVGTTLLTSLAACGKTDVCSAAVGLLNNGVGTTAKLSGGEFVLFFTGDLAGAAINAAGSVVEKTEMFHRIPPMVCKGMITTLNILTEISWIFNTL